MRSDTSDNLLYSHQLHPFDMDDSGIEAGTAKILGGNRGLIQMIQAPLRRRDDALESLVGQRQPPDLETQAFKRGIVAQHDDAIGDRLEHFGLDPAAEE